MFNTYTKLSIIWAGLTASLMSVPGRFIPRVTGWANFILDNIIHFIFFLVLSILLSKSIIKSNLPVLQTKAYTYSIALCFIYGTLLELIQTFIPERAFEWADVVSNLLGAIFGAGLVFFLGSSR